MRILALIIIAAGFLGGIVLTLLSVQWPAGSTTGVILLTLGSGIVSTALISLVLDLLWSKERAVLERKELEPFYDRFRQFADQLSKLEGRLEAFKQLGLNYCHASRSEALTRFLGYAREIVSLPASPDALSAQGVVSIVSSSARGLIGYLDRDPQRVQREWRDLITAHPMRFRILLTHPAYAHLRQPAEERASGDIELEVLKTAIYLHSFAGMTASQLRLYRGSPTVFTIQVRQHILLNPYPYGKMAMDTLCLEFESESDTTYVANFVNMHFNHTWAFIDQDSKTVDRQPLVVGVDAFENILDAFSECTYLGEPERLRLVEVQVRELDRFTNSLRQPKIAPPGGTPFMDFVRQRGMRCSDQPVPHHQASPTAHTRMSSTGEMVAVTPAAVDVRD